MSDWRIMAKADNSSRDPRVRSHMGNLLELVKIQRRLPALVDAVMSGWEGIHGVVAAVVVERPGSWTILDHRGGIWSANETKTTLVMQVGVLCAQLSVDGRIYDGIGLLILDGRDDEIYCIEVDQIVQVELLPQIKVSENQKRLLPATPCLVTAALI